jgi:hypothetical protein
MRSVGTGARQSHHSPGGDALQLPLAEGGIGGNHDDHRTIATVGHDRTAIRVPTQGLAHGHTLDLQHATMVGLHQDTHREAA